MTGGERIKHVIVREEIEMDVSKDAWLLGKHFPRPLFCSQPDPNTLVYVHRGRLREVWRMPIDAVATGSCFGGRGVLTPLCRPRCGDERRQSPTCPHQHSDCQGRQAALPTGEAEGEEGGSGECK